MKDNPDAEILLESLTPLNECKFNEEDGQLPMSLSYDGQHLRPETYSRCARVIQAYI